MSIPILKTKLYIPRPHRNLVPRTCAMEALDRSLAAGHRLTLVSAPAGFGKTTLLSEWAGTLSAAPKKIKVAWLSLDEGDNDPARFLVYLISALQTAWPGVGQAALAALQSPQPLPIETMLTGLVNEIAEISERASARASVKDADQGCILILDDYHDVVAQPVHDTLAFLLEHSPPLPKGIQFIIASRSDPPLPLARLRGRRQLTEVRVSDLRFSTEEAATLLNTVMGLELPAADVRSLEQRTEGWITGLQLAGLSLQGQNPRQSREFVNDFTGSHRFVLDYLAEEVLLRQPEPIQLFLLQTSILDRLTAPLCDAVCAPPSAAEAHGEWDTCPCPDSQGVLEELERANLFIMPLDDERRWYRYHRLFADLLRVRLVAQQPVEPLHQRASEWYEGEGFHAEAVNHALAAKDTGRASVLVEGCGLLMLMRGELTTLLTWVKALPEEAVVARPWLCVYHAWALLLSGQIGAALTRLHDAERGLGPEMPSAESQDMRGHMSAIRAYGAAMRGDVDRAVELARRALELLAEENLVVRSVVAFALGGTSILKDDLKGARKAFTEATRVGQASGNLHIVLPATCSLAGLEAERGHLRRAAKTYRRALSLAAEQGGQGYPTAGQALVGLGNLAIEWNHLAEAEQQIREGVERNKLWGSVDSLTSGYLALAKVLYAQRDLDGALDALQQADGILQGHTATQTMISRIAALWPRLWLAEGNMEAAQEWATGQDLHTTDRISYVRQPEYLAWARVLLATRELGKAGELLAHLEEKTRARGHRTALLKSMVLRSLLVQAQGDGQGSVTVLGKAVAMAEAEGYVRVFVDEGEPLARLLRQVIQTRDCPDYARTLLAAFASSGSTTGVGQETRPGPAGPAANQFLIEPLSTRELEVLGLAAVGMSNQEIADRLVITVGTVKSHLNHIFGKLGVKNRTQAGQKARELGLL